MAHGAELIALQPGSPELYPAAGPSFLCQPVFEPEQYSHLWNVLPQEAKEAYMVSCLGHPLGR